MALLKQHYTDGKMLTCQIFSTELDCIFSKLKLDRGSYNTHSFWIGMAISAIEAGIPETPIKMLGRWQSNGYQGYVKTPTEDLAKLSKLLASKCKPSRNEMWSPPALYSLWLIITLCTSSITYCTMQSSYITDALLLHFSCCNILISYVIQQPMVQRTSKGQPHMAMGTQNIEILGWKDALFTRPSFCGMLENKVPSLTE